jgi:hypothetical protein
MINKKQISLKLRVIAAEAESLAEDLDENKLWDGDLQRRISILFENLTAAQNYVKYQ